MVQRASENGVWSPPAAADWNQIGEAAEAYQRNRTAGANFPKGFVLPHSIVKIKNASGADRVAGNCLQLRDLLTTDLEHGKYLFDAILPTNSTSEPLWQNTQGILPRAIENNGFGDLILSGLVRSTISVGETSDYRCTPVSGSQTISSKYSGPWEIVWKPSGTGSKTCLLSIGPKRPATAIAYLSEALAAGSPTAITSADGYLARRNKSTNAFTITNQFESIKSYFGVAFAATDYISVIQDEDGDWWLATADC